MNPEIFKQFCEALIKNLNQNEELSFFLIAEESIYLRFNQAKIRQATKVWQGDVTLTYVIQQKRLDFTIPFTHDNIINIQQGLTALAYCRKEAKSLPIDPFYIPLNNAGNTKEIYEGTFPKDEEWFELLMPHIKGLDFVGLLTAGKVIRANANSKGQQHWYQTNTFLLDASLYNIQQQSVKLLYGDKNWSDSIFEDKLNRAKAQLKILNTPPKLLTPQKYRTYFAPEAVSDLIGLFSWNGVNAASFHQGRSCLKPLLEGKSQFSPLFSLSEDFSYGFSPRFNSIGEIAPSSIHAIKNGHLENLLISTRTAKEYNLQSNYAEQSEVMRAPILHPGSLTEESILSTLDTGLYVSNVHYLNWSDLNSGRLTGMTRYACFWVENGQIISPIQNLRFDESIYHLFGKGLIGLTNEPQPVLLSSTYQHRATGGKMVPGILVDGCTYTL